MTIPKRDKRKRRAEGKAFSAPPADKMVKEPDIMKRSNAPRICLACGRDSFSTICKCGRLTVFKNKIKS